MNRPQRLVIVRHAESQRNLAKQGSTYFADDEARQHIRGIPDHLIELTEEGHRQAEVTGPHLRKRYGIFDYVYHTGYRRTIDTTEGILAAYPDVDRSMMKVRHNAFLRERDPGYAYDMTENEAEAAFPWLKEHWKTFGGFLARPPGGESLADVVNRVYTFIGALFRDRAGDQVLIVTHGGTLRCIRFLLERWDYEQALRWPSGDSPANCGITVYEFNPTYGRLVLMEYNTVYWDASRLT